MSLWFASGVEIFLDKITIKGGVLDLSAVTQTGWNGKAKILKAKTKTQRHIDVL